MKILNFSEPIKSATNFKCLKPYCFKISGKLLFLTLKTSSNSCGTASSVITVAAPWKLDSADCSMKFFAGSNTTGPEAVITVQLGKSLVGATNLCSYIKK